MYRISSVDKEILFIEKVIRKLNVKTFNILSMYQQECNCNEDIYNCYIYGSEILCKHQIFSKANGIISQIKTIIDSPPLFRGFLHSYFGFSVELIKLSGEFVFKSWNWAIVIIYQIISFSDNPISINPYFKMQMRRFLSSSFHIPRLLFEYSGFSFCCREESEFFYFFKNSVYVFKHH